MSTILYESGHNRLEPFKTVETGDGPALAFVVLFSLFMASASGMIRDEELLPRALMILSSLFIAVISDVLLDSGRSGSAFAKAWGVGSTVWFLLLSVKVEKPHVVTTADMVISLMGVLGMSAVLSKLVRVLPEEGRN